MILKKIIIRTAGRPDSKVIFKNAAQVGNHTFYWQSLKPAGGGEPPVALKQNIEAFFGSVEACKQELAGAAVSQFGSGGAWLVLDGKKLRVEKTGNADASFKGGHEGNTSGEGICSHGFFVKGVEFAIVSGKAHQFFA